MTARETMVGEFLRFHRQIVHRHVGVHTSLPRATSRSCLCGRSTPTVSSQATAALQDSYHPPWMISERALWYGLLHQGPHRGCPQSVGAYCIRPTLRRPSTEELRTVPDRG